jgi:hypothetical protein
MGRGKTWLRAAAVPLVLAGCEGTTEPVLCTAIAVSALNVTVRDQATSQRICDATVTASLGSTTYTLRPQGVPDDCTYAGAEEVAGTFEVRATRSGYEAGTASGVRVTADECHVIPARVTIDLRRRS